MADEKKDEIEEQEDIEQETPKAEEPKTPPPPQSLGDLLRAFGTPQRAPKNTKTQQTKQIKTAIANAIVQDLLRGESKVAADYMHLCPWLVNANALGTCLGNGVAGSGFGLHRGAGGAIEVSQNNVYLCLPFANQAKLLGDLGTDLAGLQQLISKLP